MIPKNIKKDFPLLQRKIHGRNLVYLNSAATSQKPEVVINALRKYYEQNNANIHRGNDFMSVEATKQYDLAREKVATFIGAEGDEIIFTKGTTESINLLMYSLGQDLKKGDEIILSVMEHHSNIVPWQFLRKQGVILRFVDIDDEGRFKGDDLKKLINKKTKLISVSYVSNVLGTINPIKEICELADKHEIKVVIDAAQAVPHFFVNVKELDCDFLAFSGHKMLAPMGIGILYGKKKLLERMRPFLYGGDMIKEVSLNGSTFAELPRKFEAGTPNVEAVIGLGVAVDYLEKVGMENVQKHERELARYASERLQKIKGITVYGPKDIALRSGVISFNLQGIHAHDVAEFLGSKGIAVRAGHMCCQPLMKRLGIGSCVRISFYIYNREEDVDLLCNALEECRRFFKI